MKCPIDGIELVMADRQGVEIDYCPQCRGVWLDRGELDKIIDRMSAETQTRPQAAPPPQPQVQAPQPPTPQNPTPQAPVYTPPPAYGYRSDYAYKHKRKKGLLGELFDF